MMNTLYAVQTIEDNSIPQQKIMSKKLKKKLSHDRKNQYALIKKQCKALQSLHKNEGKLHIFSAQLTCLIDTIPDTILFNDREGRKLITSQLTTRFFKQHDIDWYGSTSNYIERRETHSNLSLESELHFALEKAQFQIFYQTQVDVNRQMIGVEALLRWEHPQYGLVVPEQFIPIAEQSGLIVPIGAWVLQSVCEQLKLWQTDPLKKDLSIAVNISPSQFSQAKFVKQLRQLLEETGIDATRLRLELTETMMLLDISKTVKKMEALQLLGVRFSMDNFGTGYSSLSQLKKLPIDQLKIDQFLMRNIVIDSSDAMVVKTIIDMTNRLGINVIAGGVETEHQFSCLKQLGCSGYQGYLFGDPMPLNEFEKRISHTTQYGEFIEETVV
jgi:FOG: EAL domain